MSYNMVTVQRIYSNAGYWFEVRPDPDGLIEIRYFEDRNSTLPRQAITLTEDCIPLIVKALEHQIGQLIEARAK